MKIFKFGGASVKDAEGVRNLASIIQEQRENLIVVVSAMGKTTNHLEVLCNAYFHKDPQLWVVLNELKKYHQEIVNQLFPTDDPVYRHMEKWFNALQNMLSEESSLCYDYEYDRIICFGELLSTTIVSDYLQTAGLKNQFIDIRKVLKSDQNYRNANIDLTLSEKFCKETFTFSATSLYVTQGFIAWNKNQSNDDLGTGRIRLHGRFISQSL